MKRTLISLLMASLLMTSCAAAEEDSSLRLMSINVGKADCHLLASGESLYMIDTGTAESWGRVSSALHQLGITRVDGVILTHTHDDHAGGAWALAQSDVEVGAWYAPEYFSEVKEKKHPGILAAQLDGQEINWLRGGDELPLDGGSLKVLGPVAHDETKENNNSLVLLAQTADGSILLTGDMEFPEEDDLLDAGLIPQCTVLKIGNHAEDDATSNELVAAVKPRMAVISTNSVAEPDTPSRRVLTLLRNAGAEVVMTENAALAVLVTLHDGVPAAQMLGSGQLPPVNAAITIAAKDQKGDSITLHNAGEEADLSGWFIRSERGGEMFVFPRGARIGAGETVTVTGENGSGGDFNWPEKKIWHKSKDDRALLYDAYGRQISTLD